MGRFQTLYSALTMAGDRVLEVNRAEPCVRHTSHEEHDARQMVAGKLQKVSQTERVMDSRCPDKAPISVAEYPRQTFVPATASASNLHDLNDGTLTMIDISYFTTRKVNDKRPCPSGIEYKCELEPLCLATDSVEKVKMGTH